jgi:hypothetical protein
VLPANAFAPVGFYPLICRISPEQNSRIYRNNQADFRCDLNANDLDIGMSNPVCFCPREDHFMSHIKPLNIGIVTTVALGLILLACPHAHAGLIGNGTNTVNALFFHGAQIPADEEMEDHGSPPTSGPATIGSSGVNFLEGALDHSIIHVGDTQITITNQAPSNVPYGSTSDSFDGFEFQFSSGVDITGVTVDPASAADFGPRNSGVVLASPTDILVNIAGDAPNPGDPLILDLSVQPVVPEPASLTLLTAGLLLAGGRRKGRKG